MKASDDAYNRTSRLNDAAVGPPTSLGVRQVNSTSGGDASNGGLHEEAKLIWGGAEVGHAFNHAREDFRVADGHR